MFGTPRPGLLPPRATRESFSSSPPPLGMKLSADAVPCMSHIPAGAPCALPERALAQARARTHACTLAHKHTNQCTHPICTHQPLHTLAADLLLSHSFAYVAPLLSTPPVAARQPRPPLHCWSAPGLPPALPLCPSLPGHPHCCQLTQLTRSELQCPIYEKGTLRIRDGLDFPMVPSSSATGTASCPRTWPLTRNCSGPRPHTDRTAQADRWDTGDR